MKLKVTEAEKQESLTKLREMLKPGDTVYTILRHVSSSGMSRIIDMVIARDDQITSIAWHFARISGCSWENGRYYGVKINGCGMDMGFECVCNLGRYLYPDGFGEQIRTTSGVIAAGLPRPETKEDAARITADPSNGITFRGRNGDTSGWDNDGGYALNQRWL